MVPNEQDIRRVENQVMGQIHDEISNTIFKNHVLERGILGKDGILGVEKGENSKDCSWGAMAEGDEATCSFRAEFWGPILEDYEIPS